MATNPRLAAALKAAEDRDPVCHIMGKYARGNLPVADALHEMLLEYLKDKTVHIPINLAILIYANYYKANPDQLPIIKEEIH